MKNIITLQVMEKAAGGTSWHYAHFCVINQGGIRTSIEAGGN